jgi:sugar-specific transcriptional regulator TrmB
MNPLKLQDLGMTLNEAKIYLGLLELGETKIGPLVKRTGIHRVLIYDALSKLINIGLASSIIKENIQYFQATDPSNILKSLEEKRELAKKIIQELKEIKKSEEGKQRVTVYEGVKGLKSAMNNMLKEIKIGGEHRVFASGNMAPIMGDYYYLYQKEKKKKRIKTLVIYDKSFKKNKEILKATYGNIKFHEMSPFPTDTWIYSDKVLIVTYTANPPVAILIQSKETSDSYKKVFNSLWGKT